ncbi:MAG TPA: metallophosphoesterase [Xanthobacteraceae bacterium]|jgi:3',5'-cyclic AMP phosphodiesterase CpdA
MFVLAHLSDPHLSPLPQPRWSELIGKRATGYINWRRKRRLIHRPEVLARVVQDLKASAPDHIAVTGDLVNISLAHEYAPARAFLESLGSARDVTLVPGNHDLYVRGADGHFRLHWGDYMRGEDGGRHDPADFPFMRRCGSLALIGLSSAVPTAPFLATGRLGKTQIDRLAGLLERARGEGRFRVVLLHHPPRGSRRRHFMRLIDTPILQAALERHGAELLLHGHDHVRSIIYLPGPHSRIPAVGVPSASQVPQAEDGPAGYNLYRISGQPGDWHCELSARVLSADGEVVTEVERRELY